MTSDRNIQANTLMNEITIAFEDLKDFEFDFETQRGVRIVNELGELAQLLVTTVERRCDSIRKAAGR